MEEPLTDAELEAYREALVALRAQLQERLSGADERAGTVDLDQAAVGRLSRVDALQQQQMALAERRRSQVQLKQIARALLSMDEGEYGDCTRCGEEIGRRRLSVRPETPFCVACATALGA